MSCSIHTPASLSLSLSVLSAPSLYIYCLSYTLTAFISLDHCVTTTTTSTGAFKPLAWKARIIPSIPMIMHIIKWLTWTYTTWTVLGLRLFTSTNVKGYESRAQGYKDDATNKEEGRVFYSANPNLKPIPIRVCGV